MPQASSLSALRHALRHALRGNVILFGLISFWNDLSSEMIYPLLPVFFTGLLPAATAAVYIGLMDGIAESVASLLKIYAGRLSDALGRRKPLAVAGYGLSTLARPAMALASAGWQVVAFRLLDRVGKGIRTAPRDALLSDSIEPEVRGLAFSFQRLMDHAGAVAGPLVAALFLYLLLGRNLLWRQDTPTLLPVEVQALRWLFLLAVFPGLIATLILWRRVREAAPRPESASRHPGPDDPPPAALPARFPLFLAAIALFGLGNSSDLFLVFYAQTRFGLGLGWVIVLWLLLHLAKIAFSLPGGRLSDRAGRRLAILAGWLLYTLIYLAIPFTGHLWLFCGLLVLYGAYYGLTEGAERALVADLVPSRARGRAYGLYHGAVGLAALPASLLFGVFWARLGPRVAFWLGGAAAAGAVIILAWFFALSRPGERKMEP